MSHDLTRIQRWGAPYGDACKVSTELRFHPPQRSSAAPPTPGPSPPLERRQVYAVCASLTAAARGGRGAERPCAPHSTDKRSARPSDRADKRFGASRLFGEQRDRLVVRRLRDR